MEFEESKMVQKQFHINENKTIHVDTMIAKHKEFNYSKNKKCKVLAIPYKVANLPIFFSIVQWTIWHGFFVKQFDGKTLQHYILAQFGREEEVDVSGLLDYCTYCVLQNIYC